MKNPILATLAIALVFALVLFACDDKPDDPKPIVTTCTVTFNTNGATSGTAPDTQTVKSGSSITLPSGNGLTKTDCTFGGWNTNAEGTGTSYAANSLYTVTQDITLYAKWIAEGTATCTVTFNTNEATSGTAPDAQTANSGSSITLPSGSGLTKTDCTFFGWNTNADGTGTNYAANSLYTVTQDITLYAKWIAEGTAIYTITFDANGGSGTAPAAQTAISDSGITLPNNNGLTKTGCTFFGWNTNAEGTGTNYAANSSYTFPQDITLYAQWIAEGTATYMVTFYSYGGSAVTAQTLPSGAKAAEPQNVTMYGYTFAGWFRDSAFQNQWNFETDTVTANITLYAQWTRVYTYTVTFNANRPTSGTAPDAQTVISDSSITLPNDNGLTRTGCTFSGWNTTSSGTGTDYAADSSYTVTRNITLYAKWTCTVIFDSNGATGGTAPDAQTVIPDSRITIPNDSGLTKTGCTFGGWNTNAEGTGSNYNAGASYRVSQNITLYAKWTCTVTFNSNGGSAVTARTVNYGEKAAQPNNPTRSNYTFAGWFSDDAAFQNQWDFATDTVTQDITLYAKWVSNPCTVTFNSRGGSEVQAQIVERGAKATEPHNPTMYGFTFGGWYDRYGSGNEWNFETDTVTQNITLFAEWWRNSYTVTFNSNGGNAVTARTVDYDYRVDMPYPTRSGYTFDGWYSDDITFQNQWNFYADKVTQDITLYAKWNIRQYTVTFNANGATNGTAPDAQTVDFGSSITIPNDNGLTRTGYTFGGWNTYSGTNYSAGSSYTVTENSTLYAKWTLIYTVTFDSNGGSAVQSQIVNAGDKATQPQNPTRNGYTFAGWLSDPNYQNQLWNFTTGTINYDITLYAKWNINRYTVTFNSGGGTPTPAQQTVDHGAKAAQPQNVTRSGYTFAGWYSDSGFQNQWNFATDTVTANITLYAKWNIIINQYTVTFNSGGGTTTPAQQTVDSGNKVTEPQNVTRSGYSLVGWFRDNNTFQNQWNFATNTVTANITLYARWALVLQMVYVPGGTFQLGKDLGTAATGDVTPVSNVTLTSFYIGKHEVTQKQWQDVMGSPSYVDSRYGIGDNYPVYGVKWFEALVFCNKLSIREGLTPAYRIANSTNPDDWGDVLPYSELDLIYERWNAVTIVSGSNGYRLPTEAQWEYAAKGGNPLAAGWVGYTYAGSNTIGDVAWYDDNSGSAAHEVGTKAPNGLGLYDMSGNVTEWCWDVYGDYTNTAKTNPTGPGYSWPERVMRGGGYNYFFAESCRSAERNKRSSYNYPNAGGFRLVRPAQ